MPLRDRGSRLTSDPGSTARPWLQAVEAPSVTPSTRRRHAWAQMVPDSAPVPALVLRWVREAGGWSAWIVAVTTDGQAVTLQIPAEQLQPVVDD